jgi:hypothetical protein
MVKMDTLNCDIRHVVQGLKTLKESENYDTLQVWDSEAVMRGIDREEMKERNLFGISEPVVIIEKEVTDCYKFKFHESQVENEFVWDGHSRMTTKPKQLGGNLKMVVMEIEDEYGDILWDFAEMSAGSIGHEGFCDFEFEFEMII